MAPHDEVACLPKDATFKFIGEGSANVVFQVIPPLSDPKSVHQLYKEYLLRMPKAGKDVFPYPDHQAFYHDTVIPAIGQDFLAAQRLVRIPMIQAGNDVVPTLNAYLATFDANDKNRRKDWIGARVAPSPSGDESYGYGMLVENLGPKLKEDIILEIKPKWLQQSPNAPPGAKRCRVCAKTAKAGKGNEGDGLGGMCPLKLLKCRDNLDTATEVWKTVADAAGLTVEKYPFLVHQGTKFVKWLMQDAQFLFFKLRNAQVENDPYGALKVDDTNALGLMRLQTAMTMRDCTCFIRFPGDMRYGCEAKLADLDKKNGLAKLKYWQESEQELIDGGFYMDAGTPVDCCLNKA